MKDEWTRVHLSIEGKRERVRMKSSSKSLIPTRSSAAPRSTSIIQRWRLLPLMATFPLPRLNPEPLWAKGTTVTCLVGS
eukprot:6110903-Heterocapsa_arctica.AAC.1